MGRTLLLALDAGGGSGHAGVVDVASRAVTRAQRPWRHPAAPGTGGLGVDADLPAIWEAIVSAAREALETSGARPGEVAGIATTSMRHTTVVLDRSGMALFAALALVAVGVLQVVGRSGAALSAAGWSFLIGSAIFSGSLYVLSLTGLKWLGAITPIGGVAILIGWAALAVAAGRPAASTATATEVPVAASTGYSKEF